MDLKSRESLFLRALGPDWSHCQLQFCEPAGTFDLQGLWRGQVRRLRLASQGDGLWRVSERGRSWVLRSTHFEAGARNEASARRSGSACEQAQAPMDGRLRELAVTVGEQVKVGQILYVLEAMKMQVQVTAVKSGQVEALLLPVGSQVRKGQQILHWKGQSDA